MQRITIKNEQGAILATIHAHNPIIQENNGVRIEITGGPRTINTPHTHTLEISRINTGPAGRQIITTTKDTFITTDGYTLKPEGKYWTDGDLKFLADREGHPIDDWGNRLQGHYKPT